VTLQKAEPSFHGAGRNRQNLQKSQQAGNRGNGIRWRARFWNPPRIGHN
jgi:hypothetical protein